MTCTPSTLQSQAPASRRGTLPPGTPFSTVPRPASSRQVRSSSRRTAVTVAEEGSESTHVKPSPVSATAIVGSPHGALDGLEETVAATYVCVAAGALGATERAAAASTAPDPARRTVRHRE